MGKDISSMYARKQTKKLINPGVANIKDLRCEWCSIL